MAAHQASPSLGFSRQEHWSGLLFPSPVLLPGPQQTVKGRHRVPAKAGDMGSVPGLGRSPGEGNGNPLILAGEIPWIEESRGLQSVESQRVGHN